MRILVLGDSLGLPRPSRINDYSPTEKELAVCYGQTYSSLIQKELFDNFKHEHYFEVINRSERSCTLKDVAEKFPDYLFFYEPDVIILQIGIVDCWIREGNIQYVDIKSFAEYYKRILQLLALRPKCQMIIVGISPTSKKMDERHGGINKQVSNYNLIYKASKNNKNIFYIDMEMLVEVENLHEYLLKDDHHLNPNGNRLVANQGLKILTANYYCQLGFNAYSNGDFKEALSCFEKSFFNYPQNNINLYNFLIALYEHGTQERLKEIAYYCKENAKDITDDEITNIANLVLSSR